MGSLVARLVVLSVSGGHPKETAWRSDRRDPHSQGKTCSAVLWVPGARCPNSGPESAREELRSYHSSGVRVWGLAEGSREAEAGEGFESHLEAGGRGQVDVGGREGVRFVPWAIGWVPVTPVRTREGCS